ncbi:MAG: hypothetical protein U0270_42310 [Labilithrix sp.]
MGRALVFVAVMGLMPEPCARILGQPTGQALPVEPPPPIPSVTATAPPTYQQPEPPLPPSSAKPDAVSPELAKAREANDKKDYKKVKTILEKKVKAGKGNREETQLLMDACTILQDKACKDMVRKANPNVVE